MVLVEPLQEAAFRTIQSYTGSIVARSIINGACATAGVNGDYVSAAQLGGLLDALENGTRAFLAETHKADECVSAARIAVMQLAGVSSDTLRGAATGVPVASATHVPATPVTPAAASAPAAKPFAPTSASSSVAPGRLPFGAHRAEGASARRISILQEFDIVTARGEARTVCQEIGFPALERVKIATVVSELARNIVQYAGTGHIDLKPITEPRKGIEVVATDQGTGIPNIGHVLSGEYTSRTGMGVGLVGTKRLMDDFTVDTGATGTRIVARRFIS
jgi:serine/threonine-protein kinase RsbT